MIHPQQLVQLLDDHAAALELYAAQWADIPEDIVQIAFIRLAQQTDVPAVPVAWLYRVVRNEAISTVRSLNRRNRHEAAAAGQTPTWFQSNKDNELDAETATEMLRQLPPEEREIVVARIWGVVTFEQISDLVEVSQSTAHRRYETALATLRRHLASCEAM